MNKSILTFLEIKNIMPTWSDSSISGIYITLFYFACSFVLSIAFYFIFRAIAQRRKSFVPKFTLSLTVTITSFLALLTSAICFILFWNWFDWEYFDTQIPELPVHLIPLVFFFLLTLSFLIWFLFERRKKTVSKDPSSVEALSISDEKLTKGEV